MLKYHMVVAGKDFDDIGDDNYMYKQIIPLMFTEETTKRRLLDRQNVHAPRSNCNTNVCGLKVTVEIG